MKDSFFLHDWKTGKQVLVLWLGFSSEGSPNETGTNIWWTDEHGNKQSAFVRESPEQINEIMQESLKNQG